MSHYRERRWLLRVGRGDGWRAARDAGGAAADDVIACVLDDPRWDRQVEQRDAYYATLLLVLGADLAPLVACSLAPHAEERDAWLLFGVLGELGRRGSTIARGALDAAASRGPNVEVARAERDLARSDPPRRSRVAPRAEAEVASVIEPEEQLAHVETFLRHDAVIHARAPSLQRAERGRERRHWLRTLDGLPPSLTLARAREWIDAPWPLSLAAERVLAAHATATDRVALEARTTAALERGEYGRVCSLVEALGTIGHEGSQPTLCRVHDEVPYAYARRAALEALTVHPHSASARSRSTEALWDCDASTRALAADTCDLDDAVARARVEALAIDPFEAPDVRAAAEAALAAP